MGNETQKMAQADVTVEEDAGGNKMIVVEGQNIRLRSENYNTGKIGAKRVVLVPESARSGNKQVQVESEESVSSYDSYDKRGQKEMMVVTNGRLRESTYTGPNASVKVAKISTPTNERKEVSVMPQPQSSEESTPRGRVTRVNVVKRQVSSSTSDGQSVDEVNPRDVRQSILLFEKPQQVHRQRMHIGEKDKVRRLTHQNHPTPDMVKEVTIRPQHAIIHRAEPRREENKIIRVANSAHLARSLKGDEIILEKSPPPNRIVREHVSAVREGVPPHISREQNVKEIRHNAQIPLKPKPPAQVRRDDDNVFNSQYRVRRENPLFASQNANRNIHRHGHVVVKQAETNGNRDNRHLGHVVVKQTEANGNRDNRHLGHVVVKQAAKHVADEEPHYATINKVRNQGNQVRTEVHVTPVSPISYNNRPKQLNVHNQKTTGSESKEYGLSSLLARQACQSESKVEKKIVHDEVEGEITETKIVKTESIPTAPERRSKKETKVAVASDGPLPRKERLAHVIVDETITPTQSRRVEKGLDVSLLESGNMKERKSKVKKNVNTDADVQRSGTSPLLTHRTFVDSNTPASSELTSTLDGLGAGTKQHTTHWLIPDVSNRSEVKESEASVASATYRSNLTVGPRIGTVALVARDVTDLVVAPKAKKRPASDSEVKCQTQSIYYINVRDDTPLEVNLEPAENVMDIGHGGIYIEDVHPNVESTYMSERSDNDDTASVRSMYYTEIDLDKNLSCLLPGWRNEEDEDVLKNIDAMDEDEENTEARTSQTKRSNIQVARGNILIKNAMSASNGPKYVDVMEDTNEVQSKENVEVDDIANVFDNHFHVNRENPLYNSDNELNKEESRNVRERFAPHNKLGRSESRSRYGETGQLSGEAAHNSSYFDGDTGFNTSFSTSGARHGYSKGHTSGSYLIGHQSPMITRSRKVNSDVNGLVYAVPKAVFKSMTHFDRQRVGNGSQKSEDVLLSNAQLPDQFFYAYEGSKLKKHLRNGTGHGQDTVDGAEQITATVSSNVHSERQTLEEMAATRQQRLKPNSNSVRQNVHVDHEESDIKGEPHLFHADGSDANSLDLLTFDTVSEDVNLGVKDGVAQVEVKVKCERVSPIEGSADMWRKSAVIITRLIQINLEGNDERRELYRKILTNELGGKPMIDNKPANLGTFQNGEVVLDKKQTFHVYSALMGIADEEEREALLERRPSKLLSLDSGEPEDVVGDVHRYVKARKSIKKERSHRKHHHRKSSKRGDASGPSITSADLLY
ncbi:uncharacterized protein LOC135493663 [Lineus longissimus]|uniref:uncharacterized protein LOC135493663 n=1 Tax=Lineus longissimus TaxID=88925 RepID=UPI00315DAFA2